MIYAFVMSFVLSFSATNSDDSHWIVRPCESEEGLCLEFNKKYLPKDATEVFVIGDCPSLGMVDYNFKQSIKLKPNMNGNFELRWTVSSSSQDCEVSYVTPDPNPDNEWSWAHYGGSCLYSITDPHEKCGKYLNCAYSDSKKQHYVCNIHFDVQTGQPTGKIDKRCEPEALLACNTGLPGICSTGIMHCLDDGSGYGPCEVLTEVETVAEVCGDGIDQNCNGLADDGCK